MTRTNLRILQLNIKKSRPCMEALINDSQTRYLDILLIQEPPVSAYKTHVNHRLWHLYQPTCATEAGTTRSLLYVNKRLTTSLHRQIQCDDPDITILGERDDCDKGPACQETICSSYHFEAVVHSEI